MLTWKKGEDQRIGVEARYRNFLKGRGQEEVFELGWIDGRRCSFMSDLARDIEQQYEHDQSDGVTVIDLPDGANGEDLGRRLALMATTLREAPPVAALDRVYAYLESASAMEINFWAIKLLDQEVGPDGVVPALLLMSRAMRVRPAGGREP